MKIINIVGARPNFMKMAPIIEAMNKYPNQIEHILVHKAVIASRSYRANEFDIVHFTRIDKPPSADGIFPITGRSFCLFECSSSGDKRICLVGKSAYHDPFLSRGDRRSSP